MRKHWDISTDKYIQVTSRKNISYRRKCDLRNAYRGVALSYSQFRNFCVYVDNNLIQCGTCILALGDNTCIQRNENSITLFVLSPRCKSYNEWNRSFKFTIEEWDYYIKNIHQDVKEEWMSLLKQKSSADGNSLT